MPSAAGIAFTLLSLLLAWLLWRGRGAGGPGAPDSVAWLRIRSAIPPLLLLTALPSGCGNERFDTLRLYAEDMIVTQVAQQGGRRTAVAAPGCDRYFRSGEAPVFVVGRARGCVDLVVQDPGGAEVDGALVRLDHAPGGDAATLRLSTQAGGGSVMVAAHEGEGGRNYAGAVPIKDGDQICIARCTGSNQNWWTFRSDGSLEPAGGGEARTLRVRDGPYGWIQPYGPSQRIHRLAGILCPEPESDGACSSPVPADSRGAGEAPEPALSFLFQRGGFQGSDWLAMLVDPGAQLRRAEGGIVRPDLTQTIPLGEGDRRHVSILAMRGNTLRDLRSFSMSHDLVRDPSSQRSFRLALDTPELVPIGHCERPLSRLAVAPDQSSAEAFTIPAFGNRPNSVLASAAAGLPIEAFNLCRSTSFAFSAPLDRELDDASAGSVRRQIAFSADRMGIPWTLIALAIAVALVVHAASERLWLTNRLDGQILILAQYLLVLRAMIGIEGVFADPALNWRLIYGDVGTALVTLPAILVAARSSRDSSLRVLASVALFTVLAVAALWWWLGAPNWISQLLAALALAALAARAATLLLSRRNPPADPGEEPAAAPSVRPRSPARFTLRGLLSAAPTFWPLLLGAIVIFRIVLGLLGFRERLFGVALSAIYIPLLLVCIGALLAQAEATSNRQRVGFMFLGVLAIGIGLVAIVINDIGFALVHVPPIAGIALWRLRRWSAAREGSDPNPRPNWRQSLPWAAPAAALVIGYFALWGVIALTPPPSEAAPLEQRVAYAVQERSTDPNWLRLRAVFAPSQIGSIGTRNAAVQLDQSLLLQELTGTILGRGWLTPVDLGTFRYQTTHFSDYLSASHIMAPFGRAGAIALLLVLAAAAGAAVTGRAGVPAAWPNLAGTLAIWTMFGAAAYMVLANLLLVPFTGRNIYLLAASSGGDLIEGLGLLLMARIGLAHGRTA